MKPVIGTLPVESDGWVTAVARPRADGANAEDTAAAAAMKAAVAAGRLDEARPIFDGLVRRQQRRASRLAYYMLRDAAEADEAVQDAFLKVYSRISTYREDQPFEAWFTRILVNGCLDRRKARARRDRWLVSGFDATHETRARTEQAASPERSPEEALLHRERGRSLAAAIDGLPDRQRTVFSLCHQEGRTTKETAALVGLSESTVRVHLFRAVRKLRRALEPHHERR